MSVWDDPDLAISNDYIKFEDIGDTASGVVRSIRVHRFDNGQVAPQILLACDDGEERTVTAGQTKLKVLLNEQRPDVGDHITIKLTDVEKRAGGKTLKHFTLDVKPGTGDTSTPAAPAAPAVDEAAVAAALAALTPEQKKAMGIPA